MKKYINGHYIELTADEVAALEAQAAAAEREYWTSIDYEEAVNLKIRERYTESQEFAVLRQKEDKPTEYAAYYEYCEECKAFVKEKKSLQGEVI